MGSIAVGDLVRIRRGHVGSGFRFTVSEIEQSERGTIVYGTTASGSLYGPVFLNELEPVK